MSYSWVQQHGYPEMAEPYIQAYHVVREADLLCSYDVDRSIFFHINKAVSRGEVVLGAFANATDLFESRVLPLRGRGYYTTAEGYIQAAQLEIEALKRLEFWSKHTPPPIKKTELASSESQIVETKSKQSRRKTKLASSESQIVEMKSKQSRKKTELASSESITVETKSKQSARPVEPVLRKEWDVFGTECSEDDRLDGEKEESSY
jgi:hypothetical protein